MDELRLPRDLVDFLLSGRQLEYDAAQCEARRVTLLAPDDLRLVELWVTMADTIYMFADPHSGINGSYAVPAVSLIADCAAYDPFGLLVWLPKHQTFGSFDGDHGRLYTFPGVDWSQIVSNPVPYINCQWRPTEVRSADLQVWLDCEFRNRWHGG